MKKLIRSLKRIDALISQIEDQIHVTERSEFYSVFGSEKDRQNDIANLNASLKEFLSEKFAVLENIKMQATLDMMDISSYERKVTLLKSVCNE
jgi:hypothetical protein